MCVDLAHSRSANGPEPTSWTYIGQLRLNQIGSNLESNQIKKCRGLNPTLAKKVSALNFVRT